MEAATILAALLCTTTISLLPNVLLFIFPNYKPDSPMLSIGQALAAGGLLGDVFLHTLPHAMMDIKMQQQMHSDDGADEVGDGHHHGHDHGHGHEHDHIESIGLAILIGFLVFFVFDIFVRSFGHHDHEHDNDTTCNKKNQNEKGVKTKTVFSSTVILNLIGDSLHNFTDGIAIGASFAGAATTAAAMGHHNHDVSSSLISKVISLTQSRGGLASLAVLFHEIPHELGDFAILVSAGMSKSQAIKTQFTTAIAAYCGTVVGLIGMEQMKHVFGYDLMIPFTAGGFIYLAAVTILPSLLEEKRSLSMRVVQIMSFCIGIAFMYFVAILEHQGGGCGHSHSHSHDDLNEHVHDHHGHSEHANHAHVHEHVDHHDHGHHHHDEF